MMLLPKTFMYTLSDTLRPRYPSRDDNSPLVVVAQPREYYNFRDDNGVAVPFLLSRPFSSLLPFSRLRAPPSP